MALALCVGEEKRVLVCAVELYQTYFRAIADRHYCLDGELACGVYLFDNGDCLAVFRFDADALYVGIILVRYRDAVYFRAGGYIFRRKLGGGHVETDRRLIDAEPVPRPGGQFVYQ